MHEQICEILGLTPKSWPPDHYALLGLKRGESDVQLIEQRVHERMRQVRPYQLNYPDQVTDAMNRLAQAFACLTDSAARQAYDASLHAPRLSEPGVTSRTENGSSDPKDPLAWLFGPWDHLGDPEPSAEFLRAQPHFRDWAASAPPPRQKKLTPESGAKGTSASDSAATTPSADSQTGIPRSSFFLRYSGVFLTILSIIALLAAAWRQLIR
jgi:hypothetical protein